jgi:hypothetical protein
LENIGRLAEFLPEGFRDFRNGVNSNAIEAIFQNNTLNPVFQILSDKSIILIEVWKSSQPAIFDLRLVVPVIDVTVGVIVLLLVERVDSGEVVADWADMVGNYVHHDPNAHRMSRIHQLFQGIFVAEVAVYFFEVASPIAMVAIIYVLHKRSNPNCIKPQVLYVLQVACDSRPAPPAVIRKAARAARTIRTRESVRKQLVHCARFPCTSISAQTHRH